MLTRQHLYFTNEGLLEFLHKDARNSRLPILFQIYTTSTPELIDELSSVLDKHIHSPITIGASTNQIIYNGEVYNEGTLIVMTVFQHIRCDVFFHANNETTSIHIPKELYNNPNLPSFVQLLSTSKPGQSKMFLDTIKNILPNTFINGGILTEGSRLFYNGQHLKNGYVGIVFFGEKLEKHQFYTTSIIPIGREHTITEGNNHTISSIDNIPAKAFYESYLGQNINNNLELFGYKFPLLIKSGDVVLPSPIDSVHYTACQDAISDNECNIFSKIAVAPGDTITLGYGDINYYLKEMSIINDYLPGIPCEYLVMFTSSKRTLDIISHLDKPSLHLPLFGLLTEFEFIEENGISYISSEGTTINCMSGSEDAFIEASPYPVNIRQSHIEREHSILLKLVESTSKELNTLNKTLEKLVVEKTEELLNHYYIDQLTQLPNLNRLTEDLAETSIYSLGLIDISAFININNFYGATIGNKVLTELASLITKFNDQYQFKTYRIHSDVFAVASYDASFRLFCNRMRLLQTRIHKHCFVSNNQQIYINTTLALSNMQMALYENTSMTLEHAKAEKISYLIYNERLKIEDSIISNLTWTSKIRNAIDENRIVPFFQPIYNNTTEKIDRFEVLMRLIDEDGNVISPYQFLPIAKKAGLYNKLTKLIIKKAFEYFKNKPYKFSINISAEDIVNSRTRSFIYNRLVTFPRPEQVIFEIVESESIENYDTMIAFISEIKQYGAQIAIDDFGTGFSNFHYLFKLNVDCIKIDGSIIQQMQIDPSAQMVAETIVSFADKMGITTVAEYVSDKAIFTKAKNMGINFSQGYFVAMPASDIVI